MKERTIILAPSDSLLDLVVEQYQQDNLDGDTTAFYDILDRLPREVLMGYLSPSRQRETIRVSLLAIKSKLSALEAGVITDEEVSA